MKNIINFLQNKNRSKSDQSQEIRYKSTNKLSIAVLWTIIGSFSFGIVFACFSRIDEIVITRGELQAIGAERPVKLSFDGIVEKILVKEGDEVKYGQNLIILESEIYHTKKDKLNFQLSNAKKTLLNESDILMIYANLIKDGAVSYIDYLSQKNKVLEISSRVHQIKSEIKEIDYQLNKTKITSPINGKVFNLIPSSPGYSASEGEVLLVIVPSEELEAKVFFSNSDIGFIRRSIPCEIRIDSYPFTQFGHIKGTLKAWGDEALPPDQFNTQPRFPGYVKLSKQFLEKNEKKYFLQSGQTLSANFIVRDKPLITLLTDVIANAWDSLRGIKTEGSIK